MKYYHVSFICFNKGKEIFQWEAYHQWTIWFNAIKLKEAVVNSVAASNKLKQKDITVQILNISSISEASYKLSNWEKISARPKVRSLSISILNWLFFMFNMIMLNRTMSLRNGIYMIVFLILALSFNFNDND